MAAEHHESHGWLVKRFQWIAKHIIQTLTVGFLLMIATDIAMVYWLWDGDARALEQVFYDELELITGYRSLDALSAAAATEAGIGWVSTVVATTAAAVQMTLVPALTAAADYELFAPLLAQTWPAWVALVVSLQIFALRVGVLVVTLPLWAVAAAVGFSHGASAWYLRRRVGDREHGWTYHRAKRIVYAGFLGTFSLYLFPPVALDPAWVLPPAMAVFGVSVYVYAATWKKYF